MNGLSELSKALSITMVLHTASDQLHQMVTTTVAVRLSDRNPLAGEPGAHSARPISTSPLIPSIVMISQPKCRKSVMEMFL